MDTSKIRANADLAAIAKVLASVPAPDGIPARKQFDAGSYLKLLPRGPLAKRREAATAKIAEFSAKLAEAKGRYRNILDNGLNAIGDYDLGCAYSGNPVNAVKFSLQLANAHISYYLSLIAAFEEEIKRLDEEEKPFLAQLALFFDV